MKADDGGRGRGFAEDDVIFNNHYRANFFQFWNFKNIKIINFHKRAMSELTKTNKGPFISYVIKKISLFTPSVITAKTHLLRTI